MKTIILGFNYFDPAVFEDIAGPKNDKDLQKFVDAGGSAA